MPKDTDEKKTAPAKKELPKKQAGQWQDLVTKLKGAAAMTTTTGWQDMYTNLVGMRDMAKSALLSDEKMPEVIAHQTAIRVIEGVIESLTEPYRVMKDLKMTEPLFHQQALPKVVFNYDTGLLKVTIGKK